MTPSPAVNNNNIGDNNLLCYYFWKKKRKEKRGRKRRGEGKKRENEQQQLTFVDHLLCDRRFKVSQQTHFVNKNTKAKRSLTACPRSINLLSVRGSAGNLNT